MTLMKLISYILIIFVGLVVVSNLEVAATITEKEAGFTPPRRINFSPNRPAVPGEILVKFKQGTLRGDPIQVNGTVQTSQASVNALFAQLRVRAMTRVFRATQAPLGDIYRLRFHARVPLFDALRHIAGDPGVEWVEPNYVYLTSASPADPRYPQDQWGLVKIQAGSAWDISQGDPDTVIAVIDTGVDHNHPDLEADIWHNPGEIPKNDKDDDGNGYVDDHMGWDFVSVTASTIPNPDPKEDIAPPDNDPMDFQGHGTHCSGIASAVTDNDIGIAGTAWNCKIMALRAGYKTVEGDGALSESDVAPALEYAADNGAHVISMSWGTEEPSYVIWTAIQYVQSKDRVLVAAAGNEGTDTPHYPAARPGVIAVAASDENDDRALFNPPKASNYGSWVDIAAPGKNILSTYYNNLYAWGQGTSMATPFVAGAAALTLSQDPTLTAGAVAQRLLDSADDVEWDVGWVKRLNAYQALRLGENPPDAPTNLVATAVSSSRIDLTWDDVNNETGYKIQRKKTGESFQQIAVTAADLTSYINTGLQPDTTYTYRICAYNANGDSGWSNEDSATTFEALSITINTPTDGEKIRGGSSYDITWQTTGSGIDHIHLLYSANGGGSYEGITAYTSDSGEYEWYPVPTISSSTVRVKGIAEDASHNPLAEDATGNFTIDSTPPSLPIVQDDGEHTDSTTQLHASWASSDAQSGIAEYQYAIGITPGGTDITAGWKSAGIDTEVTETGLSLTGGQTYYFAVKAQNGVGLWSGVGVSNGIIAGLSQELHLYAGWNLISIYVHIMNTDILSVLAPIDGLYRAVYAYDAALGVWRRYIPDGPDNDLATIEHGKGYLINMIDEAALTIPGERITDTAILLRSGRNLVGYNSSRVQLRENVLLPAEYTSIWAYNSITRTWLKYIVGSPDLPNILTQLEPGRGYYIYVEGDCTWAVPP